jgi:hypothetical protein
MKKIALSLLALAAISTVSFAGDNRNWELRDAPTYYGKYSSQLTDSTQFNGSVKSVDAFAAPKTDRQLTNFERLNMNMKTNELNSH